MGLWTTKAPSFSTTGTRLFSLPRKVLDDLSQFGDPTDGFYLATVLRYIEQIPYVLLKDVPYLQNTRGYAGRRPDGIMWRVLQPGLDAVWAVLPPGIIKAESAIEFFQYLVSLRPPNNQAELRALRNTVMGAGLPDSEIKPVRDLRHMCDTLRILSRAIGEYESRSHTEATEATYAARLIDVMGRIYAPVASKPGSTGGAEPGPQLTLHTQTVQGS